LKSHIAAALGSKVAVGVGAAVLAFGTAGTVIALQPASDTSPSTSGGPTVAAADDTTSTTSTTVEDATTTTTVEASTTTTTAHDADDDHGRDADEAEHEHPDNFGAIVSEDAHDGGVDGHEISRLAHDRNDDRAADRDDDHRGPGHDASDDHGRGRGHGHGGKG
jgi:hypothetical protein